MCCAGLALDRGLWKRLLRYAGFFPLPSRFPHDRLPSLWVCLTSAAWQISHTVSSACRFSPTYVFNPEHVLEHMLCSVLIIMWRRLFICGFSDRLGFTRTSYLSISPLFSSPRDAGGDRAAPHSHHRGCCVAEVAATAELFRVCEKQKYIYWHSFQALSNGGFSSAVFSIWGTGYYGPPPPDFSIIFKRQIVPHILRLTVFEFYKLCRIHTHSSNIYPHSSNIYPHWFLFPVDFGF